MEDKTQTDIKIIQYRQGEKSIIDPDQSENLKILAESEALFFQADTTYRLIITEGDIEEIKKNRAVEVIYPDVRKTNSPKPIYYTRLLIPLDGRFANGTVFFAGFFDYELKMQEPDLIPERNYELLDKYRELNYVANSKGIDELKLLLERALP